MTHVRFAITWHRRAVPLPPAAVLVEPQAVEMLFATLARRSELEDSALRALRCPHGVVLLGAQTALPWVDGARYFGRDERAPRLLMPTLLAPSVAPELFEQALRRQVARSESLLLVVPELETAIDVGGAQALRLDERVEHR